MTAKGAAPPPPHDGTDQKPPRGGAGALGTRGNQSDEDQYRGQTPHREQHRKKKREEKRKRERETRNLCKRKKEHRRRGTPWREGRSGQTRTRQPKLANIKPRRRGGSPVPTVAYQGIGRKRDPLRAQKIVSVRATGHAKKTAISRKARSKTGIAVPVAGSMFFFLQRYLLFFFLFLLARGCPFGGRRSNGNPSPLTRCTTDDRLQGKAVA